VSEEGEGGVDVDVNYVDGNGYYVAVNQDLVQSPEDPKARIADEGKPQNINLIVFKIMQLSMLFMCIFLFSS
jgi:hypothetical protein